MLSAVAECAQATGVTTVTWTVANNTATPVGGTDLRYVFGVSGVEIAANSSRTGSETFVGPAAATSIDNEFYGATVIEGATVPFYAYGALNVPACVASQSTTTAAPASSTVPPSTTPPPEALVLTGAVVCGAGGDSTVTWTMRNNTATAMRGTDLRLLFGVGGVDIPANNTASATETITGPAEPESVYNEVYGFSGEGPSTEPFYASATLTVGVCTPTTTPPTEPPTTPPTTVPPVTEPPTTPVSPANPEIHLASCAAGVVTVPTVVAASGPTGVSYVVEPAGALTPGTATHTVTVTATVADGYSWGQLGAGWLPGATEASKVLTVHLAWRVV